jgi:methylenetetrahydrofolate dehydrogenase (NADP+)/methenyltetrahydrofolate cyclohydrolase
MPTLMSRLKAVFVQLPVPKQLSHIDIASLIDPKKDVDGFHAENVFHIFRNSGEGLQPCTPKGIMTLLDYYDIDTNGKTVAIIGRSLIVGKPLAMMMTNKNATVFHCHSRTKDLQSITKNADIIVSAIGKANFLDASYFDSSKEQVVIDVGMNRDKDNKLCGDIDFKTVEPIVSSITPVPGGVGQ